MAKEEEDPIVQLSRNAAAQVHGRQEGVWGVQEPFQVEYKPVVENCLRSVFVYKGKDSCSLARVGC